MKKFLSLMLISVLVLPAFAPWISHGAMHALHDAHMALHSSDHHGHHAHAGEHHLQVQSHHPAYLDFATYFSDYLHVDLKSPESTAVDVPVVNSLDIDKPLAIAIYPKPHNLIALAHWAPPDYRRPRPDNTPIYLSTQRLRI